LVLVLMCVKTKYYMRYNFKLCDFKSLLIIWDFKTQLYIFINIFLYKLFMTWFLWIFFVSFFYFKFLFVANEFFFLKFECVVLFVIFCVMYCMYVDNDRTIHMNVNIRMHDIFNSQMNLPCEYVLREKPQIALW